MTVLSGDFDMFAKKVRSSVKIEIVEKYVRSPRDAVVPSLEESSCCRFAADGTHLPCFVGSCLSASWPAEVFQTPQKKKVVNVLMVCGMFLTLNQGLWNQKMFCHGAQ